MDYEELIEKNYSDAVSDINDIILSTQNNWYNYVIKLPIHLRVVYTIVILHQQILNGGFHQYFFNGYGLFGYLTLDSLKVVNANFTYKLLNNVLEKVNEDAESIDVFQAKVFNKHLEKIVYFDEELTDFLEICDDKYYEAEEDLTQLLGLYLMTQLR